MHQRPQSPSARTRQKLLAASACMLGLYPGVGWAAHLCKAVPDPPGINVELESRLGEALKCFGENAPGQAVATVEACNDFVAASIQREWSLDHFWMEDENRFMTVREIKTWLPIEGSLSGWDFLGTANEAAAQASAAEKAGEGQPVVAVYHDGRDPGYVALVLPGELQNSGTYGIPVSRIAQTGLNNPANSFIGCSFSYGLGKKRAPETLLYGYRGPR